MERLPTIAWRCSLLLAAFVVQAAERRPDTEGFVFVDGKYLDAPYRVTCPKGCLLVNGMQVKRISQWPIAVEHNAKPKIPEGVLRTAKSFDDLRIPGTDDAWHARMFRWIGRNIRGGEDRRRELKAFHESLPFVREVTFPDRGSVRISLKDGGTQVFGLDFPPPGAPPTKEEILERVEQARERLAKRIAKGDVYLFSGNGRELSFVKATSERDLKLMVEILQSERDDKDKARILKAMGILPESGNKHFSSLLRDFQASAQLPQRIEKLVEASGIKPRTLADVPECSPAVIERRRLEAEMRSRVGQD